MGRATRWIRSLIGRGKNECSGDSGGGRERREKRRWSFKSLRESATESDKNRTPIAAAEESAAYSDGDRAQNMHAIAVAVATAAAAEAAVAAAQAAVAVVRLTSRGAPVRRRVAAAIRIQTGFRGYLAKKALRALKALVKLQALVRGYLVRKRAAATLRSMQALVRAQSAVLARKLRPQHFRAEILPPKSQERFEEAGSEHSGYASYDRSQKTVEIHTYRIPARISIPDRHNFQDYYCTCRVPSTAQSTPRCANNASAGDFPNYMANTQSHDRKARSYSTPKQRPEAVARRGKRLPLREVLLEPRASLGGAAMQRSCDRVQGALNFRIDRSCTRNVEFLLQ